MAHSGFPQIRRIERTNEPERQRVLRRAGTVLSQNLLEELACQRPYPGGHSLWLAGPTGAIQAAAALAMCPGRTALLFLWPVDGPLTDQIVAALASTAAREAEPAKLVMIQALLEEDQTVIIRGLAQAGFRRLAELVYMQRPTRPKFAAASFGSGFTLRAYSPETHGLFAQTIVASYEGTLDCPGLLGMREIEDVIASHKGPGRFVPALWLALCHQDQGVGVMLINAVDDLGAGELVYLGLTAPWRKQGLARKLVQQGLHLSCENGLAELMLAVDRQNEPAMRLYQSVGFTATTSRIAWVKAMR
jgi:ribosomal protein S18 acetylase RimI-like enzyme